MHTNQTHSLSKKRTQPGNHSAMLSAVEHLIGEFERLLTNELHLLKTGQLEGLEAIAEAKQSIIEQIGVQEESLIKLFQAPSDNPMIMAMKARLAQCRVNNRSNHGLVMLELKHANKSLELLRSVLNMDDLSLYSERGEMRINREKRRFGRA